MKPSIPFFLTTLTTAATAHQNPLGATTSSTLEDIINASPLLSFHRDLVQVESITGNEHNVGDFITDYLEAHNFTVVKQLVSSESDHEKKDKDRFNIYAYPSHHQQMNPTSPGILLTTHIDTVPPYIPYSLSLSQPNGKKPTRDSITISGRGSVDAKASIAAQTFAALETLSTNPETPLALLFVTGEEVNGDGMKHFSRSQSSLLSHSHSAFHTVVFGEPTDLALAAGHKGMLGFDVVADGFAAHSGYPWLGASAVSAILPVLGRLDRLGDAGDGNGLELPSSEKFGKSTVNIGVMRGGVAANVIPASAGARVAVRLGGGTPEEARDVVRAAVDDVTAAAAAAGGAGANVSVHFADGAYAAQHLDVDVPGFNVITVNYGTDVPNLEVLPLAVPVRGRKTVARYLYGPGSILLAHGDHEAVTVGQIEEAVRGYRRLIEAALH